MQDNFAELITALKYLKSHNMLHQTPTHLDHRSPVKIEINNTYVSTGKTRYNKQIETQQRLQINLLKTPTTKGHQVWHVTTKLKYNKANQKVTTNNFVLCLFFFPETGPGLIFLGL